MILDFQGLATTKNNGVKYFIEIFKIFTIYKNELE